MKFVLTSQHLFWWPVKVVMPDPDPKRAGKTITQEFRMQFCEIPRSEVRALAKEIAELPDAEREGREHDLILRVSRNWDGVVGDDGAAIPFSEEMLGQALESALFRLAIYRAFNESLSVEAARQGN